MHCAGRQLELSMVRQNEMQGHIVLALLVGLLIVVSPALARRPEGQQPAPDPQKRSTKEGQEDKDKPGATVGKSKLEKETGTIKNLPPLTAGQKFRLATAGVFDWGAYPFNIILSGIAQAKNDPKEWGQGWDAYGKRYGASFADNSIGTYMTTAIFPSLLHEDPRYYQLGKGRFAHRAYHAINRLFVVRTDSGHDHFNYSESIGNAVAAAISNIYHVPEDRTASRNASTFAFLILYDGMSNELKEF